MGMMVTMHGARAAEHEKDLHHCTATNHLTGNFFDLGPLERVLPKDSSDWHVRGWDFPANFTLNICAPVVDSVDVTDVTVPNNVSAYYTDAEGRAHSLGSVSSKPYFRGRNLLLEYTGGSHCYLKGEMTPYRMSSIISFKCDQELATLNRASVSYVANSNNCTFFFEVRTPHACPSVDAEKSLSPVVIFLFITMVAVGVYYLATRLRMASFRRRFNGSNSYGKDYLPN
ncbi:hypothetical protein TRVA0_083S00122 [Trichomonascus vanleenenianus]|uniref:Mrl1p n=1 Tax=Trichomonascus vanleenenianus TaxID=2268995 RepID=UPI003ECB1DEA